MPDWRKNFPDARPIVRLEGGTVYAVEREDEWWIIRDERTALEFLDEEDRADLLDRALRIERFDDRDAWADAIAGWRGRAAPSTDARPFTGDGPPLPRPNAPWPEIAPFAGSFPGYRAKGGVAELSEFARGVRAGFEEDGRLPSDLEDVRAALFYEQRSDRFADSASDPRTLAYVHALVEQIRELTRAGTDA